MADVAVANVAMADVSMIETAVIEAAVVHVAVEVALGLTRVTAREGPDTDQDPPRHQGNHVERKHGDL
jgi:hypothetical protein